MTVIAAMVDNKGVVHMMGDGLATRYDTDKVWIEEGKIAVHTDQKSGEKIVIGASGSYRLTLFCTHSIKLPEVPQAGANLLSWCMNVFRPHVWKQMKDSELLLRDKDGDFVNGGTIILGIRGKIFGFDNFLVPFGVKRMFDVIGGGQGFAAGALHYALRNKKTNPTALACKRYLYDAVMAASELREGVGPPALYINTKGTIEDLSVKE